ncbi:MAG TPA: tetratricopeptide repeat protein [Candidatus Polarisedimenticolaceae bacterium]|nr:tetratricopeptide repeat protein [Candidatus Polarisedimenticolaceae bacterium]
MKREHVAFLLGGLAFGLLLGFGLAHALATRPGGVPVQEAAGEIPSPAGPPAPSQIPMGGAPGGGGAAPMMAELQRLQQQVRDHPDDAAAWTRIANLYHDAGMFQQAVGFYEKAVTLLPNDPNVLTDLGVCYRGAGDSQKALEAFARAEKADPKHWQSLYNQVVVYGLDLKQPAEAEAALRKLEAVNPQAPGLAALKEAVAQGKAGRS